MKKNSKRYKKILKNSIKDKKISPKEALDLVKKNSNTKFDESIDVSLRINLKQSKGGDFSLRTVVNLPNGSGKKNKLAVLCEPEKSDEAKKAGADIVGSDNLIDEIKSGKLNFDKCISTPAMMAKVGVLGQILGPKGLMPNPKLGTVSKDLDEAIKNVKAGQLEYKSDKGGLVHASIGNISLGDDDLVNNIKYFYNELIKVKPSTSKGVFVKEIFLSSTMGPGLKIDETSVIK